MGLDLSRYHTHGIPPAFRDRTTPDGSPNPLLKAPIHLVNPPPNALAQTHRVPLSTSSTLLPTKHDVDVKEGGLKIPFFNDDPTGFSHKLADHHDDVHVWVGGEMKVQNWSAYDPIFWSHHCMVDRIWYLWQNQFANTMLDPGLLSKPVVVPGTSFTVADTLDITKLGYGYALTPRRASSPSSVMADASATKATAMCPRHGGRTTSDRTTRSRRSPSTSPSPTRYAASSLLGRRT